MLDKIKTSLKLTYDELVYKVTWPTWEELQESAIVVLIASLIIAMIIFAMDSVFENLFQILYRLYQ